MREALGNKCKKEIISQRCLAVKALLEEFRI